MQPIWGRLSDIFGRKYTLIACIVVFTIGSLACAVAQSMLQLIVFRALQGVGGGGLLTLVLIIVSDIVSLKDRGKYQGVTVSTGGGSPARPQCHFPDIARFPQEITIALGNGTGPLIGGAMAQRISWRWAFYLNLCIAPGSVLAIVFFLPLKGVHGSMKE